MAVAVFDTRKIKGVVQFTETSDGRVELDIFVQGLRPGRRHGFHAGT
jgi:hypothetical protein